MVFSAEGVAVVTSLAKWMRGLSILIFIGLAFVVVVTCGVMTTVGRFGGAAVAGYVIGISIAGAFFGGAAMVLRSAARSFERGVVGDDELSLGAGFRSLRVYFIIFGIVGIISTIGDLLKALR